MLEAKNAINFLNELLNCQPDLVKLFDHKMQANELIKARNDIFLKDGDFISVTGLISALSLKYGASIASMRNEQGSLTGFCLYDVSSSVERILDIEIPD